MDTELLRRIVRVEARFEKTNRLAAGSKYGTGFRVSKEHILTAQHVVERGHRKKAVERASEIYISLDVDGNGEKVLDGNASVIWTGEKHLDPDNPTALDAVLLACDLEASDLEPFRHWVRVPLGDSGSWETEGFATASRNIAEMGTEYLWGLCHPARQGASYVKLTVERRPPKVETWAGISGSPVFVKEGFYRGHLYGIVRQSPTPFVDALYAVGTPVLLRNAKLRELLGFKESAPPHASLVEKLRDVLEQDPVLAHRLARLDDAWYGRWQDGGNDDLVDVLCNEGRLQSMVEHLRHIYRRQSPRSAGAERLKDLAMVLVPILAGKELVGGEELTTESSLRIRVGTASPNYAEALLASAYGTPCLYETTGSDVPHAYLRVPTSALEGGIHAKSQIDEELEELLILLLEKNFDKAPFILPNQRVLLSQTSGRQRQELLRKQLRRNLVRIAQDRGRPAWIAPDEEMRKKMGDHLGRFLDRLAQVLPNLAIVELETGPEEVEKAIDQEDQLWPLWEILDLLPS